MNAHQKLLALWNTGKFLCIGLDPVYEKLPKFLQDKYGDSKKDEAIGYFNKRIIDATKDIVAAYKPNAAFYEAYGHRGIRVLEDTFFYMQGEAPDVFRLLDAKRADIDSTNDGSVAFAFDLLNADGITLNPYLGSAAMKPFLNRQDKMLFMLCCTSNEGAGEFQDKVMYVESKLPKQLFAMVAENISTDWNYNSNCGLVAGATYPGKIATVRLNAPDLPLLIPGVGKQGGDLQATLDVAFTAAGNGVLINSSREIIYASDGEDFAEAARAKALELHSAIFAVWTEKFHAGASVGDS